MGETDILLTGMEINVHMSRIDPDMIQGLGLVGIGQGRTGGIGQRGTLSGIVISRYETTRSGRYEGW